MTMTATVIDKYITITDAPAIHHKILVKVWSCLSICSYVEFVLCDFIAIDLLSIQCIKME